MLVKTRGIIFRSVKYSETSIIADIYTEEKGLRSYIISGVRTQRARTKASLLQVMSLVELVVYHRNDKTLTRIKEIKPAYVYHAIPFQLARGAVGLFMAELARKTIREEAEQNLPLFNFLYESFCLLDRTEHSVRNFHLSFMLQLTGFLGFLPGESYSADSPIFDLEEGVFVAEAPRHPHHLTPRQSELLDQLLEYPPGRAYQVQMTREERQALLRELLTFYRLHIEGFPGLNTYEILETVMD